MGNKTRKQERNFRNRVLNATNGVVFSTLSDAQAAIDILLTLVDEKDKKIQEQKDFIDLQDAEISGLEKKANQPAKAKVQTETVYVAAPPTIGTKLITVGWFMAIGFFVAGLSNPEFMKGFELLFTVNGVTSVIAMLVRGR